MRVLITRTAEDSIATARALEAMGHEALLAPLRECVSMSSPPPEGAFEAVIATSRHAFGGAALPAALAALPCFCVGQKTAEAAQAAGFVQAQALGGDGAALAAALLSHFAPGTSLLYLAGQPRHPALESALSGGGMQLTLNERYAMARVQVLPVAARAALMAGQADAVLHYSRESARAYLDLSEQAGLAAAGLAPLQLCLSEAVASVFWHRNPLPVVRIAAEPNEAALLALLKS